MPKESLENKVVIVTGAGSGIGAALSKAFSADGARVVLTARRKERLDEAAAQCKGETLILPLDITRPGAGLEIVDSTVERFGRIDILVNNAGLGAYGSFVESGEEQWRTLFEVNLFAPVALCRAVLPFMLDRDRGLIVNIASIGGLIAHAENVSAYVASKHAFVGFSRGLKKDLAGTGVRVLAACPHLTNTDFFTTSPGAEAMAAEVEQYKAFMDDPRDVAKGIIEQLDSDRLIVFPTEKPHKAYLKQKEL